MEFSFVRLDCKFCSRKRSRTCLYKIAESKSQVGLVIDSVIPAWFSFFQKFNLNNNIRHKMFQICYMLYVKRSAAWCLAAHTPIWYKEVEPRILVSSACMVISVKSRSKLDIVSVVRARISVFVLSKVEFHSSNLRLHCNNDNGSYTCIDLTVIV